MAARLTSDDGCAGRLRSSQHRFAAGNCDVSWPHIQHTFSTQESFEVGLRSGFNLHHVTTHNREHNLHLCLFSISSSLKVQVCFPADEKITFHLHPEYRWMHIEGHAIKDVHNHIFNLKTNNRTERGRTIERERSQINHTINSSNGTFRLLQHKN